MPDSDGQLEENPYANKGLPAQNVSLLELTQQERTWRFLANPDERPAPLKVTSLRNQRYLLHISL